MKIVIEEVTGSTISGYNIVDKNRRPVTGTFTVKRDLVLMFEWGEAQVAILIFDIILKEPGDDKYDGEFNLKIKAADYGWTGTGSWKSFDGKLNREVKIVSNLEHDCI